MMNLAIIYTRGWFFEHWPNGEVGQGLVNIKGLHVGFFNAELTFTKSIFYFLIIKTMWLF